jgi:16S rRNA processing protein RimM
MPRDEQDIVVGKLIGPFGLRGEIRVIMFTEFPERFDKGRKISLNLGETRRELKIESSRPHQVGLVLKLEGIDTRSEVEELRGTEIVIDEAELGQLDASRFYVFDLIGLKVVTEDGREQGEVTEILQGGANDVYVTSTGLCIPALKSVVTGIDTGKGVMTIRAVPGLLPDE